MTVVCGVGARSRSREVITPHAVSAQQATETIAAMVDDLVADGGDAEFELARLRNVMLRQLSELLAVYSHYAALGSTSGCWRASSSSRGKPWRHRSAACPLAVSSAGPCTPRPN